MRLLALLCRLCRAPASVVDPRRAECRECPQLGRWHGIRFCRVCGCSIRGKTLLAESSCPLHRWHEAKKICWFTALAELIDLDDDGDLDVLTCEERRINAVIWYENPQR